MQSKILCPWRPSTAPTAAAQSKSTAYLPSTTHNPGKPSGMERFAPLTDVHYSVTMEGLPIAPTHATNKKADTKRYDRRCVRTFFDRMADIILGIHRTVADRLGGI